ncbi:hypothetical protein [Novosphingobium aerophilum]|uniref:Uncharacterized protein n=1 Tax=Novosphingobium aerophilum TaxID=2839843 RepID=A0A7X1KAJ4_9SPHN|nr:hypothetical protein [Novosphingobium aerophilum]MBC2650194.1 hypothetical protein [Novosphingobium aerophilum]
MKTLTELLSAEAPLQPGCTLPKRTGDHVMVGRNHGPVFRIVHVHADLAWIRPLTHGQDGLVPLDRLRAVEPMPPT